MISIIVVNFPYGNVSKPDLRKVLFSPSYIDMKIFCRQIEYFIEV